MATTDTLYWITSDRWAADTVQCTVAELREQADDYAQQTNGEEPPAEITADDQYVYANGERIGQIIDPRG